MPSHGCRDMYKPTNTLLLKVRIEMLQWRYTFAHRQHELHVKLDHNLHWNTIQWYFYIIILGSTLHKTQLCTGNDVIHQVIYNMLSLNYVNWYKPTLHGIADYFTYNKQNSSRLVQINYCINFNGHYVDVSVTCFIIKL